MAHQVAPARSASPTRTTTHHAWIHRASPGWVWQCTCGRGIHACDAARTHRDAFIAALVHVDQQPAA